MPVGEEENADTTYDTGGDVADSDNEVKNLKYWLRFVNLMQK